MSRKIHLHQYSLLIALVIFSVASTPIAWTACPYVNGGHNCAHEQMATHDQDAEETEDSHCSKKKQHSSKHVARIDSPQTIRNVALPAITPLRDECSHCMMHSRSEANAPSRVAVVNSPSDSSIAPELAVSIFSPQLSNRALIDVHEHGPPGSQHHRYILNSTFRI